MKNKFFIKNHVFLIETYGNDNKKLFTISKRQQNPFLTIFKIQ